MKSLPPLWTYWIPVIAAGIAFIGSILVTCFNYWLFKRQERLRDQINKSAYEYQITFSKLHEKRAEVIQKTYRLLFDVHENLRLWIILPQLKGRISEEQVRTRLAKHFSDLSLYVGENRILLPEELFIKLNSFCTSIFESVNKFNGIISEHLLMNEETHIPKPSQETFNQLELLMRALESEFRSILGVTDKKP